MTPPSHTYVAEKQQSQLSDARPILRPVQPRSVGSMQRVTRPPRASGWLPASATDPVPSHSRHQPPARCHPSIAYQLQHNTPARHRGQSPSARSHKAECESFATVPAFSFAAGRECAGRYRMPASLPACLYRERLRRLSVWGRSRVLPYSWDSATSVKNPDSPVSYSDTWQVTMLAVWLLRREQWPVSGIEATDAGIDRFCP